MSDGFFNIPDKGPESQLGFLHVQVVETGEKIVHTLVVHECDYRRSQRGPCVCAVMRLAILGTPALNLAEGCEAPAGIMVQYFEYILMMSQVIGYEYCFHASIFFVALASFL